MRSPLEHFSRSSEETASVFPALLPTPQLWQCRPSRTSSNPRSFSNTGSTHPSSSASPLVCPHLRCGTEISVSSQKACPPDSPCGKARAPLGREAPSFERPLAPMPPPPGPERWLRDCDVYPSWTQYRDDAEDHKATAPSPGTTYLHAQGTRDSQTVRCPMTKV